MTLTAMVVTGSFIFLGIFDLIMVARKGVGSSVSRFLQRSALKSPVIAVALGFVLGHLLGYMAPECPEPPPEKVCINE